MNKLILRSILIILAVASTSIGSTNAYFSDSVVISGNVFSTGTWSTIVINEVYYFGDKEWVELYNISSSVADIKGWSICNSSNDCGKLNPEKKTEIPAGGYVLVSHDANDIKDWSVKKEVETINYADGKIDFADSNDQVILKDTSNNIIDQMSYLNNATSEGQSLARIPNGVDTDSSTDYTVRTKPTPGVENI